MGLFRVLQAPSRNPCHLCQMGLHCYCSVCEPAVQNFCNSTATDIHVVLSESQTQTDLDKRGIQLEKMMTNLEGRIKNMIEINEKATKSYAQVVQANMAQPQVQQPASRVTRPEKSTIFLLDEDTDRERRKCNLLIHNYQRVLRRS